MKILKTYLQPACLALICVEFVLVLVEGKTEEALVVALLALCIGGNIYLETLYDALRNHAAELEHLCEESIRMNNKLLGALKAKDTRIKELEDLVKKASGEEAKRED